MSAISENISLIAVFFILSTPLPSTTKASLSFRYFLFELIFKNSITVATEQAEYDFFQARFVLRGELVESIEVFNCCPKHNFGTSINREAKYACAYGGEGNAFKIMLIRQFQ
jgi:hypothetical protein